MRWLPIIATVCLSAQGCREQEARPQVPGQRIVRLLADDKNDNWSLSINGGAVSQVSCEDARQHMVQMKLQYGDIVACENCLNLKPGNCSKVELAIAGMCNSNRVAYYVTPRGEGRMTIFTVPAFHWVAHSFNPLQLDGASFYLEGKPLGSGGKGYTNMVRELEKASPKSVFILGSWYDPNENFGPDPSPFDWNPELLNAVMAKGHINQLRPSLPPWVLRQQ